MNLGGLLPWLGETFGDMTEVMFAKEAYEDTLERAAITADSVDTGSPGPR